MWNIWIESLYQVKRQKSVKESEGESMLVLLKRKKKKN